MIGVHDVEELFPSTCWTLLAGAEVGRLALHGTDDEIEIFPVNFTVDFTLDHTSIVFKTATGTKTSLIEEHRRAAFVSDAFDFYEGTAWSVVLRGTPEVIHPQDDVMAAYDEQIRTWQVGDKPVYVRLTPDVVTGRRFRVDPTSTHVH